jgi:hypothetical protein
MAIGDIDFGTGVSRPMDAVKRQFSAIVWQKGKPPLDSELNLMSQVEWESLRQVVRSQMPSGFLMDPTRSIEDYQFNPLWSNRFRLGNPRTPVGLREGAEKDPVVWANVNGWIIPVCGTNTAEGNLFNVIDLKAPPQSDARIDYVFLEAWQCRVDPNPSTTNKPSASTLYKYGNVGYGGTNLADDLEDPTIGYETTARIQVQYRLRVQGGGGGFGTSVPLDVYPDGLGYTDIYGQGANATPQAALGAFVNMRQELGDPGLWRAGNGDPDNNYGTIDGYVYAIPVCAIFRRGSNVYVAVNQAGNPTQNGSFNRTPSAISPSAADLTTLALSPVFPLSSTYVGPVTVTGLADSGLADAGHILSSVFLVIDGEIIGVSAINVGAGTITIPAGGRGRFGTAAVGHVAGSTIGFYNTRPDGLFADEVAATDVLDLRHAVNAQDWDFNRLLAHNVAALAKGTLRSAWKLSAVGDTQGPVVHEVDYMYAGNSALHPNYTYPVDGTDGVRTVFSDAAAIQPDVTILLDNDAVQANGVVDDTFETNVTWDVSPGFHASGWMNSQINKFTDNSVIHLYTGGEDGNGGARRTFRDAGTRGVRILTPREYWKTGYPTVTPDVGNQYPVTLRFPDYKAFQPIPTDISGTPSAGYPALADRHVGPMYPSHESNFERPFIVLGGILHTALKTTLTANLASMKKTIAGQVYELDVGIDFDAYGSWYSTDTGLAPPNGEFENNPANVADPLFHGLRTLYGMLTDDGRDRTGDSSEVYVVMYGDKGSKTNNGAFKVVGAGTLGMTMRPGSNATSIQLVPLCAEPMLGVNSGWDNTGNVMTIEFRSQHTHAEDTSSHATKWADIAIVLTDIGGQTATHPWGALAVGNPPVTYRAGLLGGSAADGYDLSLPVGAGPSFFPELESKLLISTTLQYHPGHGAMARVPDDIVRFARTKANPTDGRYLRQCPATLDPAFPGTTGAPVDEITWPSNHVQLWNRLPGLGWSAPFAPNYGGNVVGFTEQDREHELFVDAGSKTAIFRPFRSREMTLGGTTYPTIAGPLAGFAADKCLLGVYDFPGGLIYKDDLELWTGTSTTGKRLGIEVPREFMPRFGRQDIPFHRYDGENPMAIMPGINHLFRDSADITNPVFNIIGGYSTVAVLAAVNPMYFLTALNGGGAAIPYAKAGTTVGWANNVPYVGARLTTDIDIFSPFGPEVLDNLLAVNSSDLGRGLRGIQLPPYYGPARVIGVFDIRDAFTKTGHLINPTDRWSPDGADPAPNLLREDADRQSLFILRDGAKDYTNESGDHTYIIPENALDLTRCLNWDPNNPTDFANMDFVVVCTVFGFAKDWINGNNYVMARGINGNGVVQADGDASLELNEGIPMVIPCPAAPDEFYVAYNRTAYQGDVYMSRQATASTASDYQVRYGQLTSSQQYAMRWPIQQYDSSGNYVPQTPNARAFEVLASMDFYTTMGTGKIGGQLYAGTPLDVGFVENTPNAALRKPDSLRSPMWQVFPRTYSEGQKSSDNRAWANLILGDVTQLDTSAAGLTTSKAFIKFKLLDGSYETMWFTRQQSKVAMDAAKGSANVILVSEVTKPQEFTTTYTVPGGTPALEPEVSFTSANISVTGAEVGDSVIVELNQANAANIGKVNIHGWVDTSGNVKVRLHNHITPAAFQLLGGNNSQAIRDITGANSRLTGDTVAAHGMSLITTTPTGFPEVDPTKSQMVLVTYVNDADEDGLFFTGEVSGIGDLILTAHNPTNGAITWGAGGSKDLRIAILENFDVASFTFAIANWGMNIRVLHTPSDSWAQYGDRITQTAVNAYAKIATHPKISKSVIIRNPLSPTIYMEATAVGEEGNQVQVSVGHTDPVIAASVFSYLRLEVPHANNRVNAYPLRSDTSVNFFGGRDIPKNAGPGTSQVKLTGMIERFPTGALIQDSDFLCENPLVDSSSAMKSSAAGPRAIQSIIPLTNGGDEYTRFMGAPGEIMAQSDGAVMTTSFSAWRRNNLAGSRIFRMYRGGGPLYVLGGDNPGGPVDWVSESFPASITPVLKGGVLVCRAMLVRNFYEETHPNAGVTKVSDGDEIQMVIATYGMLGDSTLQRDGMTLSGVISPAGYGEGYAASDRYRLAGRPMFKGTVRQVPDPTDVVLAVYPDGLR